MALIRFRRPRQLLTGCLCRPQLTCPAGVKQPAQSIPLPPVFCICDILGQNIAALWLFWLFYSEVHPPPPLLKALPLPPLCLRGYLPPRSSRRFYFSGGAKQANQQPASPPQRRPEAAPGKSLNSGPNSGKPDHHGFRRDQQAAAEPPALRQNSRASCPHMFQNSFKRRPAASRRAKTGGQAAFVRCPLLRLPPSPQ